jgi:glycine cleavage system H protein
MRFTETHEWVRVEEGIATVGITDHAKGELGEIVHVELPKIGHPVKAGEEVCVLESTKAAADIYSPISGKIIAINESLKSTLLHINRTPEMDGWLYQIEISHPKELDCLLSRTQYNQLVEGSE